MGVGWVVGLGNPDTSELAALKWVVGAVIGSTTFSQVLSPMEVGRMFYIMSDSYQGWTSCLL